MFPTDLSLICSQAKLRHELKRLVVHCLVISLEDSSDPLIDPGLWLVSSLIYDMFCDDPEVVSQIKEIIGRD